MVVFQMKGFTLIEILAASGILAVLAILIHGSFNISVSIWQNRQQYIEQEQDARISMDILRQKISCAYHSPWHKGTGFDGRGDEIGFNVAGSDGISRVRFYLESGESDEDTCLWMEETADTDAISSNLKHKYKLCAGVKKFEVRYDDGYSLLQQEFPRLVRVCLNLTHVDIPEMVVLVRAGKRYE